MSDIKKVAFLFGGMSTEHDVSCLSAYGIIENVDRTKFEPVTVGITHGGAWIVFKGKTEDIKNLSWEKDIRENTVGDMRQEFSEAIGAILESDIVFPVLHGRFGEDGTLQGMLEMLGKKYTGCRVLASSVGMDKVYAKKVFETDGIPQCAYVWINRDEYDRDKEKFLDKVEKELGYPCFVKPSNSGSSVGVAKAADRKELQKAMAEAEEFDRRILVEEFVDGREIECAVLGNSEPVAAMPGEIVKSNEFYDYEDKYKLGKSYPVIPAEIPVKDLEKIRELAVKVYKSADCSGLTRVDFFYTKDGRILLNEINTMPGFTEISMYPKLFEKAGISYKDLITKIIEYGFSYDSAIRR